jgi:hypothetical protein
MADIKISDLGISAVDYNELTDRPAVDVQTCLIIEINKRFAVDRVIRRDDMFAFVGIDRQETYAVVYEYIPIDIAIVRIACCEPEQSVQAERVAYNVDILKRVIRIVSDTVFIVKDGVFNERDVIRRFIDL